MRIAMRAAACVVGLTLLAGCSDFLASFRVQSEIAAAQSGKGPTPFLEALRKEYAARAVVENAEADFHNAVYFAGKAKDAAGGKVVGPTAMAERRVPENTVAALTAARARLVAALDGGGRDRVPEQAAKAQRAFDCWFEEQEENHQPNDIAACRKEFEDTIPLVEVRPAVAPTPPAAPQPPRDFIVYFDFDKATIRPDAAAVLDQLIATYRQLGGANRTISAIGHADLAGAKTYNQRLSVRRAEAVEAYLNSKGSVPTNLVMTSGLGETDPRVPTPDGTREQQNRRVELRIN